MNTLSTYVYWAIPAKPLYRDDLTLGLYSRGNLEPQSTALSVLGFRQYKTIGVAFLLLMPQDLVRLCMILLRREGYFC